MGAPKLASFLFYAGPSSALAADLTPDEQVAARIFAEAAQPGRKEMAVLLVAPLLAYKLSAMANGNRLMVTLDATIVLAVAGLIKVWFLE